MYTITPTRIIFFRAGRPVQVLAHEPDFEEIKNNLINGTLIEEMESRKVDVMMVIKKMLMPFGILLEGGFIIDGVPIEGSDQYFLSMLEKKSSLTFMEKFIRRICESNNKPFVQEILKEFFNNKMILTPAGKIIGFSVVSHIGQTIFPSVLTGIKELKAGEVVENAIASPSWEKARIVARGLSKICLWEIDPLQYVSGEGTKTFKAIYTASRATELFLSLETHSVYDLDKPNWVLLMRDSSSDSFEEIQSSNQIGQLKENRKNLQTIHNKSDFELRHSSTGFVI